MPTAVVRRVTQRLWHSPTATTAASVLVRGLSLLLVLPLLLTRLTASEIAVWYLLASLIALQTLADLGFSPTFTRVLAYAVGGAKQLDGASGVSTQSAGPNWALVGRIWGTMRVVYGRLVLIAVLVLSIGGSFAMLRPIRALPDPTMGWIAWFVVLAVSGVALWGSCYAALLQGANEVAVLRRWETMTSAAAIVTSLVVLLRGGGLLSLVIANQGWMLVSVARNRMLAVPLLRRATLASRADPEVMRAVWSSAWRSGLGVAIGRGVTHVSGFLLAQLAQPAVVAAYLLALRLLQLITEFSAAPFYSRLPVLARLNAEGLRDVQLTQARRGMTLSLWAFVLAAWVVALTAHPALEAINSQVSFVAPSLWVLLATSLFIERFGAMHLQLFSTTNRIVWHVANGVSGAIYLVVSLALMRSYGAYAFAWGSFAGAAGFYAWYSARHSYREFRLRFWSFERSVALPPAVAMTALCVAVWAGWLR